MNTELGCMKLEMNSELVSSKTRNELSNGAQVKIMSKVNHHLIFHDQQQIKRSQKNLHAVCILFNIFTNYHSYHYWYIAESNYRLHLEMSLFIVLWPAVCVTCSILALITIE